MLLARGSASSTISITTARSAASPTPSSSSSASSSSSRSYRTPPASPPRTPPRPRAVLSPFSPPRSPSSSGSKPASTSDRPLHPFFIRRRAAPTPGRPRFIAHYSSTESSQEATSVAGSTSGSEVDDIAEHMAALRVRDQNQLPRLAPSAKQTVDASAPAEVFSPSPNLVAPDLSPQTPAQRRALAIIEARRKARDIRLQAILSARKEKKANASADESALPKTATTEPTPQPGPTRVPKPVAKRVLKPASPSPSRSLKANSRSSSAEDIPTETLPPFSIHRPLPGHFDRVPSVEYTRDADKADELASKLRGPLGFDMEWPIWKRKWDNESKKYKYVQGRTAVVQISDEWNVVIYHLNGETAQLGPGIRAILADKDRFKVGVNIRGDGLKLVRDGLVDTLPVGLLELSTVAMAIDPVFWGTRRLIALARLARRYLGVELDKDLKVRASEWDKPLDQAQIDYAASDAFVSLLLHRALAAKLGDRNINQYISPTEPLPTDDDVIITSVGPWNGKVDAASPLDPGPEAIGARHRLTLLATQESTFEHFSLGININNMAEQLHTKPWKIQLLVLAAAFERQTLTRYQANRLLAQVPRHCYAAREYIDFLDVVKKEALRARRENLRNDDVPEVPE